jgi:hypothetical protein
MERRPLSIPELAIISGTRAALGAGVGMLVSEFMTREQRRAVGWTLVAVGAVTTIPIIAQLINPHGEEEEPERLSGSEEGRERVGRFGRRAAHTIATAM